MLLAQVVIYYRTNSGVLRIMMSVFKFTVHVEPFKPSTPCRQLRVRVGDRAIH